jgi:hypothetical protein
MGPHCPIDLLTRNGPYAARLSSSYDADGFEQGERINGFEQCPKCGLWWPCVEEPDCWTEDGDKWKATGWWGAAVCEECDLLMVEQPDGRGEVYQLHPSAAGGAK